METLSGAPDINRFSEIRLRLVVGLFGVGLHLLLLLTLDGTGPTTSILGSDFTAFPLQWCYYSRYYIHEMILFSPPFWLWHQVGDIGARERSVGFATGAAVGLMDATKETFVISVVAAATGWN